MQHHLYYDKETLRLIFYTVWTSHYINFSAWPPLWRSVSADGWLILETAEYGKSSMFGHPPTTENMFYG